MQRLIDQVYGRSIAVFCQGPSVGELTQDEWYGMKQAGVVMAAVNRFWLTEADHGPPEIAWIAAQARITEAHRRIYMWLRGSTDRLLLTRPSGLRLLTKHEFIPYERNAFPFGPRERIIPFLCEPDKDDPPEDAVPLFDPVPWEVMSVAAMVVALRKAGATKIGVFGHDGGKAYVKGVDEARTVDRDIDVLNSQWADIANDPEDRHHIVTANLDSRCTCWPRGTKEEVIRWLTI